jgi:hypothetical protein
MKRHNLGLHPTAYMYFLVIKYFANIKKAKFLHNIPLPTLSEV